MSVYLNVLNDRGKLEIIGAEYVAGLMKEAALELEIAAPRLAFDLFRTAAEVERTVGITGAPLDPSAPVCFVGRPDIQGPRRLVCLVAPCIDCHSTTGGECPECSV